MNKRDWYAGGIGSAATGALIGALIHSPVVLVWNLASLGLSLYLWGIEAAKGDKKC